MRSAALNALICSRNELVTSKSSQPFSRRVRRAGSIVNRHRHSPHAIDCDSRSTVTAVAGPRVSAASNAPVSASLSHRGEQSVLGRVLRKNIPERRRDHTADAVVVKRIDRGLARRAAAEIAPGHDNPRVTPAGPIEREVRPFVAGGVETQIVKQDLAVFALARQLEIARRQDLVGVDILSRERTDRAVMRMNFSIAVSLSPCAPAAIGYRPDDRRPRPRRPSPAT